MKKTYFHNFKLSDKYKDKKKIPQLSNIDKNRVVDINILLNRVKIEERNKLKQKIIFGSFVTFLLALFIAFIVNIK
ncbi:hypothetical protein [Candidatus Pelagibacter sp. Uisw_090]|uniref:hypothetical protein n=1 Tax=Candidatus Pelagibacter sp. Uisw_090 TaxID=3230993 RepID=UPI0039EB5BDB